MFNQISGVDVPTSGEMLFLGKPVAGHDSREIARMGMSRSFQHVKLLPTMSVLENVAIGAHLRSSKGVLSSAWRLDRTEEARILKEAARQIERVGLAEHMFEEAGNLALATQTVAAGHSAPDGVPTGEVFVPEAGLGTAGTIGLGLALAAAAAGAVVISRRTRSDSAS